MQPLIDADIFLYEVGFGVEVGWDEPGYPPFDRAATLLDTKVQQICAAVGATAPPILFLTGKGNFRYDIAKRVPYKSRPANKPFHYKNIKAYIKGMYDYRESKGMEADDLMAIEQVGRDAAILAGSLSEDLRSIICSRDKDLRQVPGMFYSWECGNQPSFGPMLVDTLGSLRLSEDGKKLHGTGQSFLHSQCLTGDTVDSIPGLGGRTGPVKAYKILKDCKTVEELHIAVLSSYTNMYGEELGKEHMLEQMRLLNMTRELINGNPVIWSFPETNNKEYFDLNTRTIERTADV